MPQQQERKSNLRVTYDQASQYFKMPDFDTYSKAMTTSENRQALYDQLSQHYKMPEYETFEKTLASEINPVSAIDPVPETIDFNTRALEFLGFSGIAENRRIAEAAVKQQTGKDVIDVSSEFKDSPFAQHVPAPDGAADFIKQFGKAALGDPIAQASVRNLVNTPLLKPSESLPKNMSDDELDAEFAMTPLAVLPTVAKRGMYGFFRGAVEVAEGLTTPANITMLVGLARAPQGIARAFSTLFAVEMAKAVPEQVAQFKEAMENGSVEDAGQALAHIVGTGTFTALAAKHALGVGKVSDAGLKNLADDIQANPEKMKALPEPSFIPVGGKVQETVKIKKSAKENLKEQSEYNPKRELDDLKKLKDELNTDNTTDPITARDIKHKLVQQGKDLGNLTRDDIAQAKQSILESRQREVGPDKPRDVPPETKRVVTREDVKAALNETDGYMSRLKSDANNWGQRLADWFDVEAPFRRSGAPQTGIKVKGYYGQRELREEIAIKTVKKIAKDLRHDPDLLSKAVIYAENPKLFNSAPPEVQRLLAKPIRDILKYFSDARDLYASRGVDVDFKHRIRNDIEASIRKAKKENKPTDGLESALKDLDNFEFVHIPTALWFERAAIEGNNNIGRILKVMAEKKRETFRIQDLIDAGLIELKDVNAVDVIMNYGRRLGKDIGLLDIVNAAKSEGLASTKFKDGFVKPPRGSVAFRDTWVHPTLNDWLISMGSLREGMNVFEKGVSVVKMGQFYNPLFLPMYDTVQATMLGSVNPLHPFRTGKLLIKGMRDVFTQSERYIEALDNGLASTPFNNPFKSYIDLARSIKSGGAGEAGFLVKSLLKGNPFPSLRAFYDASFNLAWQLDRGIRMTSYNYLIEKGFSPQQAAQIAAKFHGDYASVPATTRRALNNIFFTPTFKIAMTKLYGNMMKGAWESTKDAVKKDGNLDPKHPAYARGIAAVGGVLIATDLVMHSIGFERDTFGVRYKKEVDTEEGPKDLVITLSNPANMPVKYAERIARSFRGDQLQPWRTLARNLEYELTPLYRFTTQLIENKDPDGNIIYNEFGTKPIHSLERAVQMTRYLFESSFAIIGDTQEAVFTDPTKQTSQERLADEIGKVQSLIMRPFVFTYLRDPEELQIKTRLDKVQSRFQQLLKEEQLEADDENVERFLQTLDVILEDIDELKDKKANKKD